MPSQIVLVPTHPNRYQKLRDWTVLLINMMSSKLFYCTLLSVSCISAVSAVLTGPQLMSIRLFLENTPQELGIAYRAKPEPTWDAYFSQYIDRLELAVDSYLNNLGDTEENGEIIPPEPVEGLKDALHELTRGKVADLITYSNVRILNQLKTQLRVSDPILQIIRNDYLNRLGEMYRIASPQHVGHFYQPYILEVARLYSMNQAMSDSISDLITRHFRGTIPPMYTNIINRFHNYQNLIIRLHHEMARYLQIQSLGPHDRICDSLNRELDLMGSASRSDFQSAVTDLSNAILSMIVINGVSSTSGTEVVFGLLKNHPEILRIMNLELNPYGPVRSWHQRLLKRLRKELDEIEILDEGNHPWIVKIRPIVEKALNLVNN
jgi:hypothetical protein